MRCSGHGAAPSLLWRCCDASLAPLYCRRSSHTLESESAHRSRRPSARLAPAPRPFDVSPSNSVCTFFGWPAILDLLTGTCPLRVSSVAISTHVCPYPSCTASSTTIPIQTSKTETRSTRARSCRSHLPISAPQRTIGRTYWVTRLKPTANGSMHNIRRTLTSNWAPYTQGHHTHPDLLSPPLIQT